MNQDTVFISYSHEDEDWKDRLVTQLSVLQKEGLLDLWDDRRIEAGEHWRQEISTAMNKAGAAVFLITAHSLSSEFILNEEVPRLLKRKDQEGLSIFPVIVKPCAWKKVKWLSKMQVRPQDGKPLSSGDENEINAQLSSIVIEIADKMENFIPSFRKQPLISEKREFIRNIPTRRNPNFTGRDAYLSELAQEFKAGHYAALTQAICGMGGIGKTQIALEYAYRYSTEYEAIWWLRAEDGKTLAADFASFATALNLPEKDAPEEQIIINAVRNWLEKNRNWLLIFDNAQKPKNICDYLPREATGHVLVTSRQKDWGKLCSSLDVETWPRQESVDFLIRRTKDKNRLIAESIAKELGDLPLALEQAAAFINETGMGFDEYLNFHRTRSKELWGEENPPLNYPDTVGTTWSLAIEKVQEKAPIGAFVLNLCSYFAPDEIPRSMISEASKYLSEELSVLFNDSLALFKGIKVLNQYSLVNAQPKSLSIHRLVQVVVRDRLETAEQKLWAAMAVQSVNVVFPSGGYQDPKLWPECATLLSHGRIVIDHATENEVALEAAADLLNNIALYMHGRALYSDAEPLFRRALEIREKQLGADNLDVAQSLNNLARLLRAHGKYTEAEPLFRQALKIREKQLGADNLDVAQSLNNLAGLLRAQGKYTDAEPLFRRALEIREKQLGTDHPDVAQSLNNLAALLQDRGNDTDAELLSRRALEIVETQLGANHLDVAQSLNILAGLLKVHGNYTDAEVLSRRALEIRKTQLGATHPHVAISLNNLALLLLDQGKYTDAEPLFRRALEIYEKRLGVDHPNVAGTLNNLSLFYQVQGMYTDAEPLSRRALEIVETQLEANHPDVAQSLNNLAGLLQAQGKLTDAKPFFIRALEIYEMHFGEAHPCTKIVRKNYEDLLSDLKSS